MLYLQTAYYDLLGVIRLIGIEENEKYFSLPIHSLSRDICLMIYQVNKEILEDRYKLNPDIKKIRNKVKLNNGNKNKKIFSSILQQHIKKFGDDIDNIGFFLEDGKLRGSSIYITYLFNETTFFNNKNLSEATSQFYTEVAKMLIVLLKDVVVASNGKLKWHIPEKIEYPDNMKYTSKDIHHLEFYKENEMVNVFFTRLLLIQNELSTCIWLEKGLNYKVPGFSDEKYILLRLVSIKIDEIMDSLINIRKFSPNEFVLLNNYSKTDLLRIIDKYEKELKCECANLRNMIHYNKIEQNFYDYLIDKLAINQNYVAELVEEIMIHYVEPLTNILSDYLDIESKKSMTGFEKVIRRSKTIVSLKLRRINEGSIKNKSK